MELKGLRARLRVLSPFSLLRLYMGVVFVAAAVAITVVFFTSSRIDRTSSAATSDSRAALKASQIQAGLSEPMTTATLTMFGFFLSDTYRSLPFGDQLAVARELTREVNNTTPQPGLPLVSVAMNDRDVVSLARSIDRYSVEIDALINETDGIDLRPVRDARDKLRISIDNYLQEPSLPNFRSTYASLLELGFGLKDASAVLETRLREDQSDVGRAMTFSRIAVLTSVLALTSIMAMSTLFLGRMIQSSFAVAQAEKEALRSTSETLRVRNTQLSALYNVFAEITDSLSLRYVVSATIREALKLVDAHSVVVRLLKGNELVVAGSLTDEGGELEGLRTVPLGDSLAGRVAKRGRAIRIGENVRRSASEDQVAALLRAGYESCLIVPLIVGARVVGTLGCWSRNAAAFSEDDERILEMMASQVATAVVAADTMDTNERRAHHDPLTDLPNRLQLHEDAQGYFSLAADSGRTAAIAMADIDHFKRLNDEFGHRVGDVTLQKIAAVLRTAIRPADRVYRYGGEEFVLVFEDVEEAEALAVAERVRLAVASTPLTGDNLEPVGPVTISIGLSLLPDHGIEIDELIKRADAAMYRAKDAGRNRVVVWEEPETVSTSAA